jgi:hypothetical protein
MCTGAQKLTGRLIVQYRSNNTYLPVSSDNHDFSDSLGTVLVASSLTDYLILKNS